MTSSGLLPGLIGGSTYAKLKVVWVNGDIQWVCTLVVRGLVVDV